MYFFCWYKAQNTPDAEACCNDLDVYYFRLEICLYFSIYLHAIRTFDKVIPWFQCPWQVYGFSIGLYDKLRLVDALALKQGRVPMFACRQRIFRSND